MLLELLDIRAQVCGTGRFVDWLQPESLCSNGAPVTGEFNRRSRRARARSWLLSGREFGRAARKGVKGALTGPQQGFALMIP